MFRQPLTYISSAIDRFFSLQAVQRLEASYPLTVGFFRNRLGMQNFLGLPLTLLLGIAVTNYAMLSEISENLVNSPGMKLVDSSVGLYLYHLRTDETAKAFYYFTQLGSSTGVGITFALVTLVLLYHRKWQYLVALLIAVLGTGISIYFTKLFFRRERPLDVGYYEPSSFSFPSGHSAGALSLFGIVAIFILLERRAIKWPRYWAALCVVYIVLIGFSRIFLGVHFISDVAGGYLLGSLWLILAVSVLEYQRLHEKEIQNTDIK
ncbi:phosphatase PAP2 family protein [Pontibacter sp. E15-1]|uniref:phosphatase PAP2 family protein n=1 Tax=Pontibacter sp. E15-1 TaxID=2919918 RepID=UPI001F4F85A4|nr:phosphatase PAP2 family protein [Pontibacter sp. E15-1]MCJ8164622.1 phosphatase PAP2 family protein [Pontibacter sp. E15-1]